MKELFLKFRQSSYTVLPSSTDPNDMGRYDFDLLLAYNQRELFSDSTSNNFIPITIEGRLMSRRFSEDPRPLLLNCLPDEIRDAITQAVEPTRLRIVSGVTAIDAMPWEALDGIGQGGGTVGVTRLIPVLLPPPPLSVTLPLRILVVATNPKDERLLDPYREIDAITSNIDRQNYVVQILSLATREAAIGTIRSFQPHVFHYVGHSGVVRGAGALVLHESSLGTTDWMSAAEIAQMLPISTRLICLSTCFTQPNYNVRGLSLLANAPQSVELPTCIDNRAEVMESDVRTFWSIFYDKLVANLGNVEDAYFAAQTSPNLSAPSGRSFSLVLRGGGAQPLRIAATVDPARFADEVQAQFASRLAAELNEKLKSYGSAAPKTLIDSASDAQSSFSESSNRAAKFANE
jgi:hypothetical protein